PIAHALHVEDVETPGIGPRRHTTLEDDRLLVGRERWALDVVVDERELAKSKIAPDEIVLVLAAERRKEDVAVLPERHSPEIDVARSVPRAVAPCRELLEVSQLLAGRHVDEARPGGESRRVVAVTGEEYGDGADAAVRRHPRAARTAFELQRTDLREVAIEDDGAVGREHAAVRLQADAAAVAERDAIAFERRGDACGRAFQRREAHRAVARIEAGDRKSVVRRRGDRRHRRRVRRGARRSRGNSLGNGGEENRG